MSNPFDFFESLSLNQIVDEIFHSQENEMKAEQNEEKIEGVVERVDFSKKKRVFQGKNRGISSIKLARYIKELIQCLRPTQTDRLTLSVQELKEFLLPYFPSPYKENLDRRIYDVLVILKRVQIIGGEKEIIIDRKPHRNDFDEVSYQGKEYDAKKIANKVRLMSIEDPNIADILKPMDWFKNTPAETIPIKSAKERFDEYMMSQDLSYLVPKPEKKA